MTKRREPLTYHRTLTIIAGLVGWDRCAAECGVTPKSVRNWSDPDCETEIRMIDAERLDRLYMAHGGDHAPFHRLFTLRLGLDDVATARPDLAAIAGRVAKEGGEAVNALIAAAAKPDCPTTRRHATKEAEDAIGILSDGLAALNRTSDNTGDNAGGAS